MSQTPRTREETWPEAFRRRLSDGTAWTEGWTREEIGMPEAPGLPAREAINRLYELGYGVKETGSGFSKAASLLLKANVDGQATEGPITVIAHKVVPEGRPEGCIGTVAEARYEIQVQ